MHADLTVLPTHSWCDIARIQRKEDADLRLARCRHVVVVNSQPGGVFRVQWLHLEVRWTEEELLTSNLFQISCTKNYPNLFIFD